MCGDLAGCYVSTAVPGCPALYCIVILGGLLRNLIVLGRLGVSSLFGRGRWDAGGVAGARNSPPGNH